jgi:hypothetical protein
MAPRRYEAFADGPLAPSRSRASSSRGVAAPRLVGIHLKKESRLVHGLVIPSRAMMTSARAPGADAVFRERSGWPLASRPTSLRTASRALGWFGGLPPVRGGCGRAGQRERRVSRQPPREPPTRTSLAVHFERRRHRQPSGRAVLSPCLPLNRSLRDPDERGARLLFAHDVLPQIASRDRASIGPGPPGASRAGLNPDPGLISGRGARPGALQFVEAALCVASRCAATVPEMAHRALDRYPWDELSRPKKARFTSRRFGPFRVHCIAEPRFFVLTPQPRQN